MNTMFVAPCYTEQFGTLLVQFPADPHVVSFMEVEEEEAPLVTQSINSLILGTGIKHKISKALVRTAACCLLLMRSCNMCTHHIAVAVLMLHPHHSPALRPCDFSDHLRHCESQYGSRRPLGFRQIPVSGRVAAWTGDGAGHQGQMQAGGCRSWDRVGQLPHPVNEAVWAELGMLLPPPSFIGHPSDSDGLTDNPHPNNVSFLRSHTGSSHWFCFYTGCRLAAVFCHQFDIVVSNKQKSPTLETIQTTVGDAPSRSFAVHLVDVYCRWSWQR